MSARGSLGLVNFFCTCFSYCSWRSTCWFCLCFKCSTHAKQASQGWFSSRCAANLSWPKLRLRTQSILNWSHQGAADLETKCSWQSLALFKIFFMRSTILVVCSVLHLLGLGSYSYWSLIQVDSFMSTTQMRHIGILEGNVLA